MDSNPSFHFTDWLPETWLALTVVVQVLLAMGLSKKWLSVQAWLGVFAPLVFIFLALNAHEATAYPSLLRDPSSVLWQCLAALGAGLAHGMHLFKKDENAQHPVYYVAMAGMLLGMAVLPLCTSYLSLLVSVELISLSTYLAVAFSPQAKAANVSLKYLIFGAVASAIMIYGISWLYGSTGSISFLSSTVTGASPFDGADPYLALFGLMLLLAGLLFKLSAAPMHLWAPTVYEHSPWPLLAFISIGPKVATLGFLYRFMGNTGELLPYFQNVLAFFALFTITLGNIMALGQQSLRRLLAYSTIAQVGFLMAAMVPATLISMQAGVFYATVLLLSNFALFWMLYSSNDQLNELSQLNGTGQQKVGFSLLLMLNLLSLTGLPPAVGFFAKLFLFIQLYTYVEFTRNPAGALLLGGAVLNAAIALYYYLQLPYRQFFKDNDNPEPIQLASNWWIPATVLGLPVLYLFFAPHTLQDIILSILNK